MSGCKGMADVKRNEKAKYTARWTAS